MKRLRGLLTALLAVLLVGGIFGTRVEALTNHYSTTTKYLKNGIDISAGDKNNIRTALDKMSGVSTTTRTDKDIQSFITTSIFNFLAEDGHQYCSTSSATIAENRKYKVYVYQGDITKQPKDGTLTDPSTVDGEYQYTPLFYWQHDAAILITKAKYAEYIPWMTKQNDFTNAQVYSLTLKAKTYCETQGNECNYETITEVTVPATCEQGGEAKELVRCSVCGHVLSSRDIDIPAGGHTEGEWALVSDTGAECGEQGVQVWNLYCADCGELLNTETTEYTGEHSFSEATCDAPATCACGATLGMALGHVKPANAVIVDATCDAAGYADYCCSRCGRNVHEVIPVTGHQPDGIARTGSWSEMIEVYNSLLGVETVASAPAHQPMSFASTASDNDEYIVYVCRCGAVEMECKHLDQTERIYVYNGSSANDFDSSLLGREITGEDIRSILCTDNVVYAYTCNNDKCEKYHDVVDFHIVAALGHQYGDIDATGNALNDCVTTLTKAKSIKGKASCVFCGVQQSKAQSMSIPVSTYNMAKHAGSIITVNPPTMAGANGNVSLLLVPATCESPAIYLSVCSQCKYLMTAERVQSAKTMYESGIGVQTWTASPSGHNWEAVADDMNRTASCTANGIQVYRCSDCGTERVEYQEILRHSYELFENATHQVVTDLDASQITFFVSCSSCGDIRCITAPIVLIREGVADNGLPCIDYKADYSDGIYEYSIIVRRIEAHVCIYGEPVYGWNDDYTGCIAVLTCVECGQEVRESASDISIEEIPAACTEDGTVTYTAVFDNVLFANASVSVTAPALGHDYIVDYIVSFDSNNSNGICTATAVCQRNGCDSVITESVNASFVKDTDATCIADALGHLDFVFVNELFEVQTEYVRLIGSALGHVWDIPSASDFIWNQDCSTCYAEVDCARGCGATDTVNCTITSRTIAPTCAMYGFTDYTATAVIDGVSYTDTKRVVDAPATGIHDYAASFRWTDGDTCSVSVICNGCGTRIVDNARCAVMNVVDVEPTCCLEGTAHKSAYIKVSDGTEYTEDYRIGGVLVTVVLPKTSHNFSVPEFIWNDAEKSAVAVRFCTNEDCTEFTANAPDTSVATVSIATVQDASDCQTEQTIKYVIEFTDEWAESLNCDVNAEGIPTGIFGAHVLSKVDAVPATCTEGGNNEYYVCTVDGCGKVFKDADATVETTVADEANEATGHHFTEMNTDDAYLAQSASCAGPAQYYYSCICGEMGEETFEYGDSPAHNWSNVLYVWNNDFTLCTASRTCGACGTVETSNALVSEQIVQSAVDCMTEKITCKRADFDVDWALSQTSEVLYTGIYGTTHKGEDITKRVTTTGADCCTSGTVTYYCYCGTLLNITHDGPVGPHVSGATSYSYSAGSNGSHIKYTTVNCNVCGAVYSSDSSTESCSYDKQFTDSVCLAQAATCTSPAHYYYSCACGARGTLTFTYGDKNASNHYGSSVYGGTEAVHTYYSCCGAVISSSHNYAVDSMEVYSSGTCTANRKNFLKCSCGYNPRSAAYVVEIANSKNSGSHSGTKRYNGSSSTSYCGQSVTYYYTWTCCGASANEYGSAGHVYNGSTYTTAGSDCQHRGDTRRYCQCGQSSTLVSSGTGSYGSTHAGYKISTGNDATCTTAGCDYIVYSCCGRIDLGTPKKSEHTFGRYAYECVSNRNIHYYWTVCSVCNSRYGERMQGNCSGSLVRETYSANSNGTHDVIQYFRCSDCDDEYTSVLTYGQPCSYSGRSCTSKGTCSCGNTIAATGHTKGTTVDHRNYEYGGNGQHKVYRAYKCKNCSYVFEAEYYTTADCSSSPTCTSSATCSKCKNTQPKLGHDWKNVGTKDVHTKCNRCGTTTSTHSGKSTGVYLNANASVHQTEYKCSCGYIYYQNDPHVFDPVTKQCVCRWYMPTGRSSINLMEGELTGISFDNIMNFDIPEAFDSSMVSGSAISFDSFESVTEDNFSNESSDDIADFMDITKIQQPDKEFESEEISNTADDLNVDDVEVIVEIVDMFTATEIEMAVENTEVISDFDTEEAETVAENLEAVVE